MSRYYSQWPEYVPVAKRRDQAAKKVAQMRKKGKTMSPIIIEERKIANTFWGKAWCDHIESFRDAEYRLSRGRSYVRHGLVVHLKIEEGRIKALVNGSSLYNVSITIEYLQDKKWHNVVTACSGSIGSLVELLQGKFSKNVMAVIANQNTGLFPNESEITFDCSCPDYANMCKHVAAVMYGIGARLDAEPELLFTLRKVDHFDLLSSATLASHIDSSVPSQEDMDTNALSELFGIEIEETVSVKK